MSDYIIMRATNPSLARDASGESTKRSNAAASGWGN